MAGSLSMSLRAEHQTLKHSVAVMTKNLLEVKSVSDTAFQNIPGEITEISSIMGKYRSDQVTNQEVRESNPPTRLIGG